ncbi:NAD(P)/FAD-dependent oxidoreductase [Streptomyces sp. BV129]|uniref:NAD(P)/FAD-dependent oxidoreductase n=1 Tax=Streptomyces sp. BV129 TaxID=2849671 RepID=UPI001C2E436F|nr:FAD-dependent oxidoreductase [Streptomyces sp. BV129]MBV1944809.1 FAD-dependent oxidoreductase [Streptomyces sp. BV129]
MSERKPTAVVLGGSLAGLLAARALASTGARVTVVERDALPSGSEPRKGLPQARHVHQLWSGGARALEKLLPGAQDALRAAGVNRVPVTTDMVVLSAHGWYRRWPESAFMLPAGRDLLDRVVRDLVLADDAIELLDRTEALGVTGTGQAVTGVRVRGDGAERTLDADLVVDATGRGSRAAHWLMELGLPEPARREVDSGLTYASRLFRAPEGAREGFPVVNIEPDQRGSGTGRGGVLLPVEDGKWLVTLIGGRADEPPATGAEFLRYACEELRHPLIGELLTHAEPLTGVTVTRTTANRRFFHERSPRWPERFVVLGDALCALNPVYGHGMSVAARSAVALREAVLRQGGLGAPGLARRAQRAVGRTVRAAWDLAIGADVFYPGATPAGPTVRDRLVSAYVGRLLLTATGNGRVARRVTDVTSLEAGAQVLLAPRMLLAAVVGPLRPPLSGPPTTTAERKAAGLL